MDRLTALTPVLGDGSRSYDSPAGVSFSIPASPDVRSVSDAASTTDGTDAERYWGGW